METIYEYKSYFCIFSFFTFCSYFPGIPRRSHCVSPLCLPVVFPRFWVEVLFHVFALIHDEFLGFSMCFCRFLILSMIYIYIIFIIITNKIRCSSKHLLTAFHVFWSYPWWGSWIFDVFFHVFDLIHDFLGISMWFSMFMILSMVYIYIVLITNTNKIRCSSKHLLFALT